MLRNLYWDILDWIAGPIYVPFHDVLKQIQGHNTHKRWYKWLENWPQSNDTPLDRLSHYASFHIKIYGKRPNSMVYEHINSGFTRNKINTIPRIKGLHCEGRIVESVFGITYSNIVVKKRDVKAGINDTVIMLDKWMNYK